MVKGQFGDLTEISVGNKPYHMALYVRFLFIDKGLRAEQVGRAIAKVKGLFWEELWPEPDLWDHALVIRAISLAGRTNPEQRNNIAKQPMAYKYNCLSFTSEPSDDLLVLVYAGPPILKQHNS